MKYMIHSCDKRLWYVNGYIVPSMITQGIPEADITVKNDDEHLGCLKAYIESFRGLQQISDAGTWHLQDDIAIAGDFAQRTRELDDGIVYGFFFKQYEKRDLTIKDGALPVAHAGYSFPCIRIPDSMAIDFADWFLQDAQYRDCFREHVTAKKYIDVFWREYLREQHPDGYIYITRPSIVEHVDWLIGGSTINKWRDGICRATYWEDEEIIEELKRQLAHRN